MLQWFADWWRFQILALAVSAINVAAVFYLPDYIAAGVVTLVNFTAGGNMIFDLINRSAWQRKVQEQAEQIWERDRELKDRERTIEARDREIQDRDREIADLRRQLEQERDGKDAG